MQDQQGYPVHTQHSTPDGIEHTTTITLFHGLSKGPEECEEYTADSRTSRIASVLAEVWSPKHFDGKVVALAPAYDAPALVVTMKT